MRNDRLKFIVDSRCFDGSCVTVMSDETHSDYCHETLEELKEREKSPHLIAVFGNVVRKKIRIHQQSLCAPFSEITKEEYLDYMDVQTPVRHTRNFFFMGEPYHIGIHRFCFHVDGRYFTGLRSVTTPRKELERQMEKHYRNLTFKGGITKEPTCTIADMENRKCFLIPYFFTDADGEKRFICNLVTGPDESPDIRNARRNMVEILLGLRRHHFLYFSGHKKQDDLEAFLEEVKEQGYTLLANGRLLLSTMNRESVSFTGTVKETKEPFFFRIYDRDLFLYLLHVLRSIKREKTKI